MKTGTISIIVALLGILFVLWFNYQTSELYQSSLIQMQNSSELSPVIVTSGKLNKLIALGIGLVGLLLGWISLRKKHKNGKSGILLSAILIILTFIPIWTFWVR